MTTSSTVSALSVRQLQEPPQRCRDPQRRCSLPKITGRKLRVPRKFVVTDVSDDELDALEPVLSDVGGPQRDDDDNDGMNSSSDDLTASSSLVRKGKTQIKGRFTITDLSPESPEAPSGRENLSVSVGPTPLRRENLSASMGPMPSRALEAPRRSSRKMASRRPFQSAGDVRPSVGRTNPSLSQQHQQQQQETLLFASFERPAVSSPSSCSLHTSLPSQQQVSHANKQTQTVFDHHLEFLAKETFEMKSTLEQMVALNAQWIEGRTSAGLVQASLCEASEPVAAAAAAERPFEQKYRGLEKAYMELQGKYDTVCQKSERIEVKNAMLEIRLQQQINRSTMLRSQLDKLTQYTEKLICESSEPTLHDYNSDLNSIFDEQSEAYSPTADETTSGGEYGFTDNVLKIRRQRWRDMDEEYMSDTNTEGESLRKTSSPLPYERGNENNRYYSDMELTRADFVCANHRGSSSALSSPREDQVIELRQPLYPKKEDADEPVSVIDSLDSMAVCPSVTNLGPNGDDEGDVNDQDVHSILVPNELSADLLKHSNSSASLHYSTVSSTSSLAGYGLHLSAMAQSQKNSGYFCSLAATSLFGPHPEPCPNAFNHQNDFQDDDTVYNVLSLENLRFHDCQSLLQAAEERSEQTLSRQRGFPFTTSTQTSASLGANEAPEWTQRTSSLLQRFTARRQKPVV